MQTNILIDKKYIPTDESIEIKSPENGNILGYLSAASKLEVDMAFEAAENAFKLWSNVSAHERMFKLELMAAALLEHKNELAELLSQEIAKPLRDSLKEVERSAEYILFTAHTFRSIEGRLVDGDKMPGINKNQKTALVTYEPLGVVLAISPFNYPINLAVTKIAPAIVAGNTVIFKPATAGALSAYKMAEIFMNILPEGVINFVSGRSSEIGDYLLTHKSLAMVAFTGSTAVGRHIQKLSTVPVYLEMGGKDAAVVLDDADLDKACDEIVKGGFSYSAQRCTAVKRIVVQNSIANEFIQKMKNKVLDLKLGTAKENSDITALIDDATTHYVLDLINDAKEKGADIITGNELKGNIVVPTLLDMVDSNMRIYTEEPFGPVLPIIRVADLDEAITVVNDSRYGLQSDIFTQNINKAMKFANAVKVGTVQINAKSDRGPDSFPFPGIKDSGMGVAGLRDSIVSMMRMKVIVINL